MGARWLAAIPALALAIAAAFAYWAWVGRAVDLPEAAGGRFPCLSYAAYREGQTPYEEDLIIPRGQIEEDLRLLAKYTSCIRTYETGHGMTEVVPIAHALGLKVLLGAWIGDDAEKNIREVDDAVRLANQYPETVQALVAGNEVLLRGQYSPEGLKRLIGSIRARVRVPVTYADLWSQWEKYPEVAEAVDFMMIHTLHYWDNSTKPVGEAAKDTLVIADRLAKQHPGKAVFIGEAGWPSTGRMRQEALPSLLNQARYVRQLIVAAASSGTGLNIIEAFDQPWKRKPEGTVGGFWGVFNAEREAKFPLTGPVRDDPAWLGHFAIAAALGLLFLLPALTTTQRCGIGSWFILNLVSQIAASGLVVAALQGMDASYNPIQALVWSARWLLALAAAILFPPAYLAARAGQAISPVSIHGLLTVGRNRSTSVSWLRLALGGVRAMVLFSAAVTMLGFVFDGRHRDFPIASYAVPALIFLVLAALGRRQPGTDDPAEEKLLAGVLLAGSVVSPIIEGIGNWQALAWAAVCIVLALGIHMEARSSRWLGLGQASAGDRTSRSAATSSAAPESSGA